MLILDLWGISFHAVVVFGLGKNFLFKSILGCCELEHDCPNVFVIKCCKRYFYLLCSFIKASPNSFFSLSVFCFLRFLWIPISIPGGVIWVDVDPPTQQVVNKLRLNWGYALSSIDWNLNFLWLKKQNYTTP